MFFRKLRLGAEYSPQSLTDSYKNAIIKNYQNDSYCSYQSFSNKKEKRK